MKNNKVANILFIIGIVIMVLGFIMGLVLGQETYEYDFYEYEMKIIWSVVLVYWFSSFISGMLFIGLAEIIELLDTKLSWIQRHMAGDVDIESSLDNDDNSVEAGVIVNESLLSEQEELFVKEHLTTRDKTVDNIVKMPFEGLCLVTFSDGVVKIYNIDGFHPEEVLRSKWNEEITAWYEKYTEEK